MITIAFRFGAEYIDVMINNNQIYFRNTGHSNQMVTIDHLQLSYSGVINEFPDLKGNKDWRLEAIRRFREHLESFNTEDKKATYVIADLKKYGYIPLYKQRRGFRVEKI